MDEEWQDDSLLSSAIERIERREALSPLPGAGKSDLFRSLDVRWGETSLRSSPTCSLLNRIKEKLRENTRRSLNLSLSPGVEAFPEDFFGLPPMVQGLLKLHRGITDLYGTHPARPHGESSIGKGGRTRRQTTGRGEV
ncbi:hypothetical protein IscW_ISCW003707 [Ixodes scapularis]|uniref:Uncharacterized protein n=1 Tax=Ixodes scapularis TaxID=6945 RepID=B7PGQ0_IXOSC|nr:hypothetical protein IscW_ISCW003707 [Ixodes scapularis]|eukprot:XP_002401230.1 hypothetical protein IscW_ISCW003707 [Ixodes scapularis]